MARKPTIERARSLRREPTGAERKLWRMLRDRRFDGVKFRRQHPIGPYVADFVCVEARLVIEADGPSHDLDDQVAHDAKRTAFLEAADWSVLRLRNAPIESDESAVIAAIASALAR